MEGMKFEMSCETSTLISGVCFSGNSNLILKRCWNATKMLVIYDKIVFKGVH